MTEWLGAMSTLEQVFAYIAIGGSFALIIQLVLLLVGMGHGDGDADGADSSEFEPEPPDPDADGFEYELQVDHDLHDYLRDQDTHDHGFLGELRLFTPRGVIAHLAIFGWSGLLLLKMGISTLIAVLASSTFGAGAMILMALAMRSMLKLQESGNLDVRNALGAEAEVYITVPGTRQGRGKVMLTVQERFVELDAVTNSLNPLKTGTRVLVSAVDGDTLVVRPLDTTTENE